MTKEEANMFMQVIQEYSSQNYIRSALFFEFLIKYKNEFPANCFYSGTAYRKCSPWHEDEFGTLKSCSKTRGANTFIGFCRDLRPYQFTCKNAFDLENIILYLNKQYKIKIPCVQSWFGNCELISERANKEAEIIAIVSKKDFKKEC